MDRVVSARVRITVIGYDGAPLSPAARAALDEATLVVGGARHLAAVGLVERADGDSVPVTDIDTVTLGPLAPAIDALAAHVGPAVVLASGDPGFFGVLRALRDAGLEPAQVIPAVSSVAAAFARAGVPWDDALVVSAHGEGHGRDLRRAANVCRAHPKVALLTGPGAGAAQLARELLGAEFRSEAGDVDREIAPRRTLVVAQRLGDGIINRPTEALAIGDRAESGGEGTRAEGGWGAGDGGSGGFTGDARERVEFLTLDEAASRDGDSGRAGFAEPNVVLCLDPALLNEGAATPKRWLAGWGGVRGGWAFDEAVFAHRDGQITKAEVRAQIVARLAPGVGDLVWDLGAGSGSVGIECARFGAAVVAVEQDADSCERIAENAAAHGVEVAVVRGRAPGVLARLPRPDAVFVGGGGLDVVRGALEHGPERIVVALASVERVGEVVRSLEADGREVGGVLTQFSRMAALPDGTHRFAALNPVYLVWGSAA